MNFQSQILQVIEENFQQMTIIITIHPINLRFPKIMGVPRMKPPKELQQSLKTWSAILRLSLNQMALFPRIWIWRTKSALQLNFPGTGQVVTEFQMKVNNIAIFLLMLVTIKPLFQYPSLPLIPHLLTKEWEVNKRFYR